MNDTTTINLQCYRIWKSPIAFASHEIDIIISFANWHGINDKKKSFACRLSIHLLFIQLRIYFFIGSIYGSHVNIFFIHINWTYVWPNNHHEWRTGCATVFYGKLIKDLWFACLDGFFAVSELFNYESRNYKAQPIFYVSL